MHAVPRRVRCALALSTSFAVIGCSSAEFEATNARLENSRLLFLHDGKYDVIRPPLFSSPGELNTHLAGNSDAYERRFQRGFPAEQEDWFGRFRPVESLNDELRRDAAAGQADARGGPGSPPRASRPPRTYFLVPLEGVEPAFVEQVAQLVRAAGMACVANQPGDATQLPMPPRGGGGPPPNQANARVR